MIDDNDIGCGSKAVLNFLAVLKQSLGGSSAAVRRFLAGS